jgi:hypothetical protein
LRSVVRRGCCSNAPRRCAGDDGWTGGGDGDRGFGDSFVGGMGSFAQVISEGHGSHAVIGNESACQSMRSPNAAGIGV